jgi:penicillin-binding protein 1A
MVPPSRRDAGRRQPYPRRPRFGFVRRLAGFVLAVALVGGAAGGFVAWTMYTRFAADLPTVDGLRNYQPRVMSRVYAGDDRLLAELATERRIFVPETAIPDLIKRAFVSAEDQNFWIHRGVDPTAILRAAITDLEHLHDNRRPIGASTITQQVAKNMLLGNNAVSLARKAKEAILATRIENALPKQRILELYLNEIYLGQGAYGVAAAAQTYFNKPLDQLSIEEAAMLAALPKAPNNYNPFRAPEAARTRRDWVIDRMIETHAISREDGLAAKARPVVLAPYRRPDSVQADWFAEEVRRQLIERFGQDATTQGGLTIRTSLDPALQDAADTTLRAGLMAYDRAHGGWRGPVSHLDVGPGFRFAWAGALAALPHPPGMLPSWRLAVVLEAKGAQAILGWLERPEGQPNAEPLAREAPLYLADLGWARPVHDGISGGAPRRITDVVRPGDVVMVSPETKPDKRHPDGVTRLTLRQIPLVQGALVSLDPRTGRVLALSGGWSYEASQFNRATQAQRQPGSSFKPFVYLTAMEQNISPSQEFLDAPFVEGNWRPNNYEMTFNGPTPLHVALEQSLNLVTVRLARKVGMESVAKTAIAFHEVDNMPRVLPAALGAVDTTVLREAGAYASLDMGGREVVPTLIDSVQDRDGHVIWRAPGLGLKAGPDPSAPPLLDDQRTQLADPASAFQVVEMMRGVVQHGTGASVVRGLDWAIAGKTGTSQDYNDAWFAGFTPDLVTVVWVGFDTPQTLGDKQTGSAVAGPIWHDFMAYALRDRPKLEFPVPDGVTLASWSAGGHRVVDAFKPGQEPGVSTSDAGDAAAAALPADQQPPAASNGSGTGVDSGMGGLY